MTQSGQKLLAELDMQSRAMLLSAMSVPGIEYTDTENREIQELMQNQRFDDALEIALKAHQRTILKLTQEMLSRLFAMRKRYFDEGQANDDAAAYVVSVLDYIIGGSTDDPTKGWIIPP